jgi:hypothetical protein
MMGNLGKRQTIWGTKSTAYFFQMEHRQSLGLGEPYDPCGSLVPSLEYTVHCQQGHGIVIKGFPSTPRCREAAAHSVGGGGGTKGWSSNALAIVSCDLRNVEVPRGSPYGAGRAGVAASTGYVITLMLGSRRRRGSREGSCEAVVHWPSPENLRRSAECRHDGFGLTIRSGVSGKSVRLRRRCWHPIRCKPSDSPLAMLVCSPLPLVPRWCRPSRCQ